MAPQVCLCHPDTPRPLGLSTRHHPNPPRFGPLDWNVLSDLSSVFIPNGLTLIAFDPVTNTAVEVTQEELFKIIHYGAGLRMNFTNLGPRPPKYDLVAGLVNLYLAPWFRCRFTLVLASSNRYESPAPVTYSNFFTPNSEYSQRYRNADLIANVHARYPKVPSISLPPPVYSSPSSSRGPNEPELGSIHSRERGLRFDLELQEIVVIQAHEEGSEMGQEEEGIQECPYERKCRRNGGGGGGGEGYTDDGGEFEPGCGCGLSGWGRLRLRCRFSFGRGFFNFPVDVMVDVEADEDDIYN
ncbi:hypothetical protein AAF712_015115 [Marasmius tenuissimus]|uniref:Uncharacterized protein n=1 Tax=Marasmius tenuissimus TaxID=585030 RepID=A0ABR2ZAH4_9AGAR